MAKSGALASAKAVRKAGKLIKIPALFSNSRVSWPPGIAQGRFML